MLRFGDVMGCLFFAFVIVGMVIVIDRGLLGGYLHDGLLLFLFVLTFTGLVGWASRQRES